MGDADWRDDFLGDEEKPMKKRILYVCARNCVANRFMHSYAVGIHKKLDYQKECFEEAGYEVIYGILDLLPSNCFPKLKDFNPFAAYIDWGKIDASMRADVLYIRFYERSMEWGMMQFLHKIRKRNRNIKILFEFQTFPFKRDYYFKNRSFDYYRFQLFVQFLRLYVDRIVLCAPICRELYGIKTLYMPNGVKYKKWEIIPLNKNKDEIHLIAVSSMLYSHGYDRLIKGMGAYYKQRRERKVILHLVGNGEQEGEYRKLAHYYGISGYVLFEGYCTGEKLEELYLLADVGIDGFGMHRQGENMTSSALKLIEEAAYGLPIVTAGKTTLDAEECMKYLLKFPEDETDIDVEKIVSFYDRVYDGDKTAVRNTIKEAFRPYYDVRETLREVLEYMGD